MVVVETAPYEREPGIKRISWGAIFAGTLLALVILFTLSVLGAAIGLTVLDPTESDPAQGFGIGATVWWAISAIIALFFGGWAAAKLSAVWTQSNGILHGITTWALSLVVVGWLLTSTAGAIMGGTLTTLRTGLMAGAQAANGQTDGDGMQELKQKVDELAQKFEQKQDQLTEEEMEQAAEKTVETSAAAAWASFIMLALGLASGAIGGSVGAHGNKKQIEKGPYAAPEHK